jgi:hypothetical protein
MESKKPAIESTGSVIKPEAKQLKSKGKAIESTGASPKPESGSSLASTGSSLESEAESSLESTGSSLESEAESSLESTGSSLESEAESSPEPESGPEEKCIMRSKLIEIKDKDNDASFSIFLMFISRMQKLVDILFSSLDDISEVLCGSVDITEAFENIKTPISTHAVEGFKIRNFENVLRLLYGQYNTSYSSNRSYSIDELKLNLALLKAAKAVTHDVHTDPLSFIYKAFPSKIDRYKSSSMNIREFYLNPFFKYLVKFRVNELLPEDNSFRFIKEVRYHYFTETESLKFQNELNILVDLNEMIILPEKKPMYVIITFYPNSPEGAKRIDGFKLRGYRINSIIFNSGTSCALLSVYNKGLCLITNKDIKEKLEPSYYDGKSLSASSLEHIDNHRKDRLKLLSSGIICILYKLKIGEVAKTFPIRSLETKLKLSINDIMHKKKQELISSMEKFLDGYNKLTRRDTNIFRVLEFIKLITGSAKDNNSIIRKYLSFSPEQIIVKPFIVKAVLDFYYTYLGSNFREESYEELWNKVIEKTKSDKENSTTSINMLLENVVENVMEFFILRLPNISPEELTAEKSEKHSDYILGTIHLFKRLRNVYDRCLVVMQLLPLKSKPSEEELLLRYILLEFNKIIYIKCYFISFTSWMIYDESLQEKRHDLLLNLTKSTGE